MTIDTPLALIGIRGTGVYVEITPDRNYVCLCYGQADLQAKLNPAVSEQLNTFHHDAPRYFHVKLQGHKGLFVELEKWKTIWMKN